MREGTTAVQESVRLQFDDVHGHKHDVTVSIATANNLAYHLTILKEERKK